VVGTTLFTANYSKLTDIVDAYSYFKTQAPWTSAAFNRMPKLVVNAGNDEFFLPGNEEFHFSLGRLYYLFFRLQPSLRLSSLGGCLGFRLSPLCSGLGICCHYVRLC
jgi:hypothetical protein